MKPLSQWFASAKMPRPRSLALLLSSLLGGGLLLTVLHRQGLLPAPRRKKGKPMPRDQADRIIVHMNKDHGEHLVLYAKHYGGLAQATAASIVSIDHAGMEVSVTVSSSPTPRTVRIDFPQGPLQDAKEARAVLVAMAQEAGQALGVAVKSEESDEEMLAKLDPLTDTKFGLGRAELGSKGCLAGTVKKYDTHLFVLWRRAAEWPKNVEEREKGSGTVSLPQALQQALKAHAAGITTGKAKLNVAECSPEEGDKENTLLLFPQELCVTGVTVQNGEAVIQALLVGEGAPTTVKAATSKLKGIKGVSVAPRLPAKHLFVCCHLQRDKRCGLVGPFLVKTFRELIRAKGKKVLDCPVRACSHVGGHAYAGNVISFSRRDESGRVVGDWWGYVTQVVAKDLVERHLMQGEVLVSVWRGAMGLAEEEQKRVAKERCQGCECEKTEL